MEKTPEQLAGDLAHELIMRLREAFCTTPSAATPAPDAVSPIMLQLPGSLHAVRITTNLHAGDGADLAIRQCWTEGCGCEYVMRQGGPETLCPKHEAEACAAWAQPVEQPAAAPRGPSFGVRP
jgi:hypothetical protein